MPLDTRSWLSQQRMVPFRYAGAGTVPAFGVLEITDVEKNEFDGGLVLLAQQPASDTPAIVAINSGYIATSNTNSGIATGICSFDFPGAVKTDSGYVNDTEVGPVSGQWYMDDDGSGYWSIGALNSGLILAARQPQAGLVVFAEADLDGDMATTGTHNIDNVTTYGSTLDTTSWTDAENDWGLHGKDNDKILILVDMVSGTRRIILVAPRAIAPVTSLQVGQPNKLQRKNYSFVGWSSVDEDNAWSDWHTGDEC
jgi:hypothetical protein